MMRSIGVEVCVAVGFLALALLGGPWFVASALAWGVCVASRALPSSVGRRASALMLVVGAVVLASGGVGGLLSLEGAVVGGLVLLQVQRRLTRRGPVDDRVALVVAGLMLVVTAGRSTDVGFLALAGVWACALPVALLPSSRMGPGPASLGVGGLVHVAASVAFFVLLPRAGHAPPPDGVEKLVGFSPDVELGALDALLDDPAVVFRASAAGSLPERTYWRGIALDGFDGRRWYSSTPPVPIQTQPSRGIRVRVVPAGPSDGVLFAPGAVQHVEAEGVRGDPQGGWFVPPEASSSPYELEVAARGGGDAWFSEPDPHVERWLSLPALDARVAELAANVAGEGAAATRAGRLRDWLAAEVTYTRSAGSHGEKPLNDFLLERREGHCEYLAAGLAVMLRSEGIPSRVVNGFVGGEVDPLSGDVVVRRQHAHSWTEALIDGRWVLLDATPVAQAVPSAPLGTRLGDAADVFWQQRVVGYDRQAQRQQLFEAVTTLRGWSGRPLWAVAGGVAVLLGVVLGALGLRRLWVRRLPTAALRGRDGLVGSLQRAEEALGAAGLAPPSASPPVEAARWLRGRAPDAAADAFESLAWLHYDVVFGGVPAASVRAEARRLADVVAAAVAPTGPPVR